MIFCTDRGLVYIEKKAESKKVKVVSPTHQPHFTPQKHDYFYVFWYSFLLEAECSPGPNAVGKIR
jgi:hypothetical protein